MHVPGDNVIEGFGDGIGGYYDLRNHRAQRGIMYILLNFQIAVNEAGFKMPFRLLERMG